jgi:NAD(P)-dependent dehydrogenase (short-subunit alcohol dehydrogenase family)
MWFPEPDLSGRVAIVTGASAGIGRAYALALAGAGATVIAAARGLTEHSERAEPRPAAGAETVKARSVPPGPVHSRRCDVGDPVDIETLVCRTIDEFGRIDVLVNNAGVYPHHPSLAISADDWDAVMRVNVRGAYLMTRHVANPMSKQRSGSVINLTSLAAARTSPGHTAHRDLLAYAVSKAALNRMTTYVAEDLKPDGIAVNAISPGAVLTETFVATDPEVAAMAVSTGWGKPPAPEVLGPPLLFLATASPATMTGQIVHHDEFGHTWPRDAAVVTASSNGPDTRKQKAEFRRAHDDSRAKRQ